jgi:hypothetical protein
MQLSRNDFKELIAREQADEAVEKLIEQTRLFLCEHKQDRRISKMSHDILISFGKLKGLEYNKSLGILNDKEANVIKEEAQNTIFQVIEQLPESVFQSREEIGKKTDFPFTRQIHASKDIQTIKTQSIDFSFDIFLCFSRKNRDEAKEIRSKLQAYGLRVFINEEALNNDCRTLFIDKMHRGLESSRHFVLLCTPESMISNHVKIETYTFFNKFFINSETNTRRFIVLKGKGFELGQMPLFYENMQLVDNCEQIAQALVHKSTI